jgi:NADH-quinone oxidoreductase subunit F
MEQPLTSLIRKGQEPLNLQEYEKAGGYQSVVKALRQLTPHQVTEMVQTSDLKGRGGAGFSTGLKWSFVPMGADAPQPKYLVINADEMEPGTFKDRLLLEGNPHQLIEGIICSAYAIQASAAYIFLRWEYRLAEKRLRKALDEAYQAGYIGDHILGSPFSLQIYLHVSAGRYICGEETALLNALEGKRANPRSKPPFPPVVGLWGKPTIVNNTETISNIPHIVNHGADWFKKLSLSIDGGTKIYGASGQVKRPGAWELPMGTSMREIFEQYAGGMKDGYKVRAIIPGGASTEFLLPEQMDIKMDFESLRKAGSRLGTGTLIILDDHTCPIGMLHNIEHFFAQESCGWCTPCWAGLRWIDQILENFEAGLGREEDLAILDTQAKLLGAPGRTFCALAPGAVEPLASALKLFHADFEQHIREKRCPWR